MGAIFSHNVPNQSVIPPSPPPPSSSPLNPPRTSLLSYFSPIPATLLTHTHVSPSQTAILKVTLTLQSLGLPPELVPRILDEARYWTGCRRLNRHRLEVAAGGGAPVGPRGGIWVTGHEEEMEGEKERFGTEGLIDRPGDFWYLVTRPLGCRSESATVSAQLGISNQTESRIVIGQKEDKGSPTLDPGSLSDYSVLGSKSVAIAAPEIGGVFRVGNDLDEPPSESDPLSPTQSARSIWLREIVLETFSRDQGWSSGDPRLYGTYNHSHSWFELSIMRDGMELAGSRYSIQNNVHAGQYMKAHRNILDRSHPLVQQARTGDRIVLWVRAQYPGWINVVQEAAITVFTTAYPPQI